MRQIIFLSLLSIPTAAFGQESYLVDWKSAGQESIDHLVNLVRIDTRNPPGNETKAADYLKSVLAAEGIDSTQYALDP